MSEAVTKLLADKLVLKLPAEARADPNSLRESTLYTLEVESVLRANLAWISALFDAYATRGPTGRADLLSLPAWLSMLTAAKLFDSDFTPREAVLAFQSATTRVVDEIKSRTKVLHLSLVDLFDALLRVALMKKLPTPDILRKAGKRSAGEHYLELIQAQSSVYENFLQAHLDHGLISNNPVGMPSHRALEALLSVIVAVVRGSANPPESTALTPDEVAAFIERS